LAQKLLQYRDNRKPLVDWFYDNLQGYIGHLKDDSDGRRVADIDPFSVFSIFNRGITDKNRGIICTKLNEGFGIAVPIPEDYNGIPIVNAMQSNFMAFKKDRKEGDIERLWNVFVAAVKGEPIKDAYDALKDQYLIKYNLTIRLFWEAKFARNQERDQEVWRKLEAKGWCVIIVWECQLKKAVMEDTVNRVAAEIRHNGEILRCAQNDRRKAREEYRLEENPEGKGTISLGRGKIPINLFSSFFYKSRSPRTPIYNFWPFSCIYVYAPYTNLQFFAVFLHIRVQSHFQKRRRGSLCIGRGCQPLWKWRRSCGR